MNDIVKSGRLGGKRIGYFDEDGVCRSILSGDQRPTEVYPYSAPVPLGLGPNDVFFNMASERVNKTVPATVPVPEVHDAGETLRIKLPDGVIAEVMGERFKGEIVLEKPEPGTISIETFGKQRGSKLVSVQGFAEKRAAAYGPIEEQLDQIYHDPEGWRAKVTAVKAQFPKDKK